MSSKKSKQSRTELCPRPTNSQNLKWRSPPPTPASPPLTGAELPAWFPNCSPHSQRSSSQRCVPAARRPIGGRAHTGGSVFLLDLTAGFMQVELSSYGQSYTQAPLFSCWNQSESHLSPLVKHHFHLALCEPCLHRGGVVLNSAFYQPVLWRCCLRQG